MPSKKPDKIDPNDFPVMEFASPKEWNQWLSKNHSSSNGVWLKFHKKHTGVKSTNHDDALEEALCYGWIDGQAKPFNEDSWLQKFTPRRAKSIWSKRNTDHALRLIEEKKMRPAGLKQIEAAKADGRWQQAYDSPAVMSVPDDFLKQLNKNKKAKKFFESLNKSNVYAITWRLQTAKKPETREKRMKVILEMLDKGEKFH